MIGPLDSCVSRFRQAVSQVDKWSSERPNGMDRNPYDSTGRHPSREKRQFANPFGETSEFCRNQSPSTDGPESLGAGSALAENWASFAIIVSNPTLILDFSAVAFCLDSPPLGGSGGYGRPARRLLVECGLDEFSKPFSCHFPVSLTAAMPVGMHDQHTRTRQPGS